MPLAIALANTDTGLVVDMVETHVSDCCKVRQAHIIDITVMTTRKPADD